jgi:predicted unusual protein kinase regulating ubiquinone biosynthesis (AarF/ABC1/UbiB family)
MGRRKRVVSAPGEFDYRAGSAPEVKFKPSLLYVLSRLLLWQLVLARFFGVNFVDRLRLRKSTERNAIRFRNALQELGPTAIKIGQQLSIRADVLPNAYCEQLRMLLDDVDPIPSEIAIAEIESTLGTKIQQVFRHFDPVPIGSASIACVYQAELLNGDKVAVKVRRPHIGTKMTADLKALSLLASIGEFLGLVTPNMATSFTRELKIMLLEELDLRIEARYTEIFRTATKKNKFVSAPRIYPELSSEKVFVAEFVSGAFLAEFLTAVETDNQEALANFSARGFNTKKIGKRLLQVFFWEIFENHYFHADPHPANIIVKPDNTFVFIDFGSCGILSRRFKSRLMLFYQALVAEDLNGLARNILATAEPLPPVDTEKCMDDLLAVIRRWFFSLKSDYSTWEEKCTGGMFMRMVSVVGEHGIASRPEAIRFFRANFLYDSIVYRIYPEVDGTKEFEKWHKDYSNRVRKRVLKQVNQRALGPRSTDYPAIENTYALAEQVMGRIRDTVDIPMFSFAERVGKVAYIFSLIVRTGLNLVSALVFFMLGRLIYQFFGNGQEIESSVLFEAYSWALSSPFYHFYLFVFVVIFIRKMILSLETIDIGEK